MSSPVAERDTGVAHPGREHVRHDGGLPGVHEGVEDQPDGDGRHDHRGVEGVKHGEGEERLSVLPYLVCR